MSFCKQCKAVLPERLPGQIGRKRLYCNDFCMRISHGQASGKPKPSHCWYCNALLDQSKTQNPKRYCSRKHAALYRQANKPKKARVEKICDVCRQGFLSAIDAQRFCSKNCRAIENRRRQSENWHKNNPRKEFYEYSCDECSIKIISKYQFTKGKYGRFCEACRLKRKRARYRIKNVRRRSLTVKPSRLSCDAIAERDGFVCHICRELVDMTLPRTSGLGATVDHVVPLSKGGSDEPENLRLAHWVCNNRKSDKIYA